jgi:hypothetical protein
MWFVHPVPQSLVEPAGMMTRSLARRLSRLEFGRSAALRVERIAYSQLKKDDSDDDYILAHLPRCLRVTARFNGRDTTAYLRQQVLTDTPCRRSLHALRAVLIGGWDTVSKHCGVYGE